MQRLPLVASLVFVCLLTGCAGIGVVHASRRAVPVVVDESLHSFEQDENRQRIARITASPELRGVVRQAAQDAMQGLLAGASEEQGHELVVGLVGATTEALARELQERVVPAAMSAMRAELLEPMGAEEREALLNALDEAVSVAARATVRSTARELPTSVAPALASSLAATLRAPALRDALDRSISEATRSALLASTDVIQAMRAETEEPTLVQRLTRLLTASLVAAFLLGAGLLTLTLWAVNLARHARRVEALTRQLLDNAGKAAQGKPWSDEMVALLAQQMSVTQLRDLHSLFRH